MNVMRNILMLLTAISVTATLAEPAFAGGGNGQGKCHRHHRRCHRHHHHGGMNRGGGNARQSRQINQGGTTTVAPSLPAR